MKYVVRLFAIVLAWLLVIGCGDTIVEPKPTRTLGADTLLLPPDGHPRPPSPILPE